MEQLNPMQPERWGISRSFQAVLMRQVREQTAAGVYAIYRNALNERLAKQYGTDLYIAQLAVRRLIAARVEAPLLATLNESPFIGTYYVKLDRLDTDTFMPAAGQYVEAGEGETVFQAYSNLTVGYYNDQLEVEHPVNGFSEAHMILVLHHALEVEAFRHELPPYWRRS